MPRARQYGFLRLDPQGDYYSDLYVPVEIIQWFENDDEVEVPPPTPPKTMLLLHPRAERGENSRRFLICVNFRAVEGLASFHFDDDDDFFKSD